MKLRTASTLAATSALALLAVRLEAHDDVPGTRYVATGGADEGHCDHNHDPCRTIAYAVDQARQGDAVKVGEGLYDFSGIDIESLLFGKNGLRGGYSERDHFRSDDPEGNPTRVMGIDPIWVKTLRAHGFIPVDESGAPLPVAPSLKLAPASCLQGSANGFPCHNVDFLGRIALDQFTSQPTSMANLWGFVDRDDNREYAIVGLRNGTAVVDVTDPANPREVGTIPGVSSLWREAKVYQVPDPGANRHRAYAYISTEGVGAGVQIIDLTQLPNSVSLAGRIADISTSHTLYVSNVEYVGNTPLAGQQAFLYVAGANVAGGAWRIYDLADPLAPRLLATNAGAPGTATHYMHDSTSVLVTDNRTTQCAAGHNPCEVLVDFNVETVELWDVTDKAAPAHLGRATYPNARYIHSGWPTADGRHVIVHDELDELQIPGLNTSIYTLDITDLRAPTFVTSFTGAVTSTDHNGYTVGDRYYVAHYKRGLVIFDLANPRALREVASFDTYLAPAANSAGTDGAWGVYPFLPSGTLLVSDIENGLFLLKRNETQAAPTPAPTPAPAPAPTPAPTPSPPATGGGGGGGALGLEWLALLGGLALLRAWPTTARARGRTPVSRAA